jgi:MFS family permease
MSGGDPSRRAFALVIVTLVGLHACMAASRVAASLAVLAQGYAEWTVGALLALYGLAPIALSLAAGRMADRHGFHRPVIGSVAAALAGGLLPVLWPHVASFALSALLTGGATSVAAVAIQREAGQMARDKDDLKRVFSWVAIGPALSNTFAPVITGVLIDLSGFRAAFAFATLLPLLAAWAAWRVPRQHQAPARRDGAAVSPSAFQLLRLPLLRSVLLVNIAMAASWDAHSFTVPVVGHARAMSASSIGLVLGAFAIAATAIRLVITSFANRIDEGWALRAAITLSTVVLAIYAWLPGTVGMMAGSALLGVALGSVQPMVLSTLHQAAPTGRLGQALGLRMLFTNAATIAMPVGFGLLAAATTQAAPMWLMAALLLAARWPLARLDAARRAGDAKA